ncbi:MAG: RelA/SpoT domain-containing protein [Magnetococcales bacterium]|nr:RelA/SpoT domain-containing protein [Magnetococcales bacterium]
MDKEDQDIAANILDQYDQNLKLFTDLKNREMGLLTKLIKSSGIEIHGIKGEVKRRDKILSPYLAIDQQPQDLKKIDDLIKIRIIVFFEDDVEKVSHIVKTQFNIIQTHLIDQRSVMDPDQFGYAARHYQTEPLDRRSKQVEYQRFRGMQTQIQVLSMLQYAWSEINNHLDNPNKNILPIRRRRAFTRLACFLELADEQLNDIKSFIKPDRNDVQNNSSKADGQQRRSTKPTVNKSQNSVTKVDEQNQQKSQNQAIKLEKEPTIKIPLNRDELANFVVTNPVINSMDRHLQKIYNTKLQYQDLVVDRLLESIIFFHFTSTDQLELKLQKHKGISLKLATHIFGNPEEEHYEFLPVGISLSLLFFALVASTGKADQITQYTQSYSFLNDEANIEVQNNLLSWYKQAMG